MMKLSSVLRESFLIYRKHFRELMLTLLLELVLRLIALAPLLFLAAPQTRPLALISIPLYLFIVLPARQNVALGVQSLLSGGPLFTHQLVSAEDYGKKVLRGLTAALRMLLWAALLIAGVAVIQIVRSLDGNTLDVLTLMRFIKSMGGNDLFRGFGVLAAIYLATLIPVLIGCAFHSGDRHAAALGSPELTKGRRGALIRLWLVGLAVFLPFAVAVAFPCASFFQALIAAIEEFNVTFTFVFPAVGSTFAVLGALVVILLLPALPLRTLMPAVYVRAAQAESADSAHAAS